MSAKIFDTLKVGTQAGVRFHSRLDDYYTDRYITKVDDLSFTSDGKHYHLKTCVQEESGVFTKKPHDLVIESWDEYIDTFKQEIQKDLAAVEDYFEAELKHIQD